MNFKEQINLQNYYWYKEGFSREELNKIYDGVARLPFNDATVFGSDNPEIIKKIRSSSVKWIPKNDEWMWLYEKLMDMAATANNEVWKYLNIEGFIGNITLSHCVIGSICHYMLHC